MCSYKHMCGCACVLSIVVPDFRVYVVSEIHTLGNCIVCGPVMHVYVLQDCVYFCVRMVYCLHLCIYVSWTECVLDTVCALNNT